MRDINIGLLGFGTVGAGVVKGLQDNGDLIAQRLGAKLVLSRIADIDLETDRGVQVDSSVLTTDAESVINDPSIDIILELVGGTTIAKDFVVKALKAGKPVVTANKALLAEHGSEIFPLAEEHGVDLYFEGSVAGCVPVIRAIREGLAANRFESISGILNGTCNYILTRMEDEGLGFDEVLADAQAKGYAEAEPSLDVDGFDAAHKAVILASLASGAIIPMDAVYVEGIRGISADDIAYARECGYRAKLLAQVRLGDGDIEVRVHPTLVKRESMIAQVSETFNAIMVKTDMADRTMYYGRGAGREPTASAVIGDAVDVARNILAGCPRRVPVSSLPPSGLKVKDISSLECERYLRVGVSGESEETVRAVFDKSVVGVKAILNKGESILVLTEAVAESTIQNVLSELDSLAIVRQPTVHLRIGE